MAMDKASGAYRTISEVADELDIPQHVLRFWETRFPQIKPMKRSGGRRYYRPGDVLLLRGIRKLLYGEGYTIKGVQRILSAQGVGVVQQAGGASGADLAFAAELDAARQKSGRKSGHPSRRGFRKRR
jgi:DNA-binding transcriptional MerR regulator